MDIVFKNFFKDNINFLKPEFSNMDEHSLLSIIDSNNIFDSNKSIKKIPIGTNLYHATSVKIKNVKIEDIFELSCTLNCVTSFSDQKNIDNSNREHFLKPFINNIGRILVFNTTKSLNIIEIKDDIKGRLNLYKKISNEILKYYDNIDEKWICSKNLIYCRDNSIILSQNIINYIILNHFKNNKEIDGIMITDYCLEKENVKLYKEIQLFHPTEINLSLRGVYINDILFTSLTSYEKYITSLIVVVNNMNSDKIKIPRKYYSSFDIICKVKSTPENKIMIRKLCSC